MARTMLKYFRTRKAAFLSVFLMLVILSVIVLVVQYLTDPGRFVRNLIGLETRSLLEIDPGLLKSCKEGDQNEQLFCETINLTLGEEIYFIRLPRRLWSSDSSLPRYVIVKDGRIVRTDVVKP